MKRCPSCHKTFDEEWLSFCTQDGTTLVEEAGSADLIDTIMPPRPTVVSKQDQEAIWNLPATEVDPSPEGSSPKPEAVQLVWQPPPPPLYARPQNKSLARSE